MARPKKTAPTIGLVDYSGHDERKILVQRYVPDAVETRDPATGEQVEPKLHAFFGDESLPVSHYTNQGYKVVQDGGVNIQHNGSVLFTMPQEKHSAKMTLHSELAAGQRDSALSGATTSGPMPLTEEIREGD